MNRISESNALMDDQHQCNVYNQSLVDSYDLTEYVNFYKKYLNITSGKILDLGSGPCNFVIALCKEFPNLEFVCYEASDTMIALAEENISKNNLSDRITIVKDNLFNASGNYDAVLMTRVLHHIDDTKAIWKKINEVSKNLLVVDLERPDNIETIDGLFKIMEQMKFDPTFIHDTRCSFMAAYTKEEVEQQTLEYNYSIESVINTIGDNIRYGKLIIYQKR